MRGVPPVIAAAVILSCVTLESLARARPQEPALDQSLYKRVSHLGWVVRDLDAVVSYWEKLGVKTSKGRFAYVDTERFGGVTTELLWNKP